MRCVCDVDENVIIWTEQTYTAELRPVIVFMNCLYLDTDTDNSEDNSKWASSMSE